MKRHFGGRGAGITLLTIWGLLMVGCRGSSSTETDLREETALLGELLFFDASLSEPAGQSCASCHDPAVAFTDPDSGTPTSEGVIPGRFGLRNTPQVSYASFSPEFHFDAGQGLWTGGQFLDGRAPTLEEQAKQPFLNPLEMNNPDPATLVAKVRKSEYAHMFETVWGPGALEDDQGLFDLIAVAIAAFERTELLSPFTSRYDAYLRGEARLSEQELRGLALFNRPDKGNCAACHPSAPDAEGRPPLFTDFSYDNLGVPRNPGNPFYENDSTVVADARERIDLGRGETVRARLFRDGELPPGAAAPEEEDGKFKVPSLRNVAVTAPYMHNGVFTTLRQVVQFYNTRDVDPDRWGPPEVAATVNGDELGNLGLTEQEVDDIVAFLGTLTDGYTP